MILISLIDFLHVFVAFHLVSLFVFVHLFFLFLDKLAGLFGNVPVLQKLAFE